MISDMAHELPLPLREREGPIAQRRDGEGAPAMSTTVGRTLRRDATEAEKRVWRLLRSRQIGAKFRRQQPIEGHIVDFVSFEHRLVIELDGGQHADADDYEERRTRCLEANGFRILRFWNNEVMENEEGVFERIMTALQTPLPAPSPSHARGVGPTLSREGRG
jgi:crossover junction endodeoxyribonuclease RuvC